MRLRHFQKPDDSVDEVSWDDFLKDYGMARLWMVLPLLRQAGTGLGPPKPSPAGLLKAHALYEKSLPHLLWAWNWDPQNPGYAVNVGIDYFHLGDLKEASDWFNQAALADPSDADAYYYGGVAAYQSGDKGSARKLFFKALKLNPEDLRATQALQAVQ